MMLTTLPQTKTLLTAEDQLIRREAEEATKARFQQVVFASRFDGIARRVRKGTLSPNEALGVVQQLVASL